MYRSESELIKHEGYCGCHVCPMDDSLSVDRTGRVRSTRSGELLTPYMQGEYLAVTSPKTSESTHIHRLMALTYLEDPKCSAADAIVNHIDGCKLNNLSDNIEWTTYSGNINHAYDTGLRSDNVHVEAMDLRTGKTMDFRSMWECARYFNRNGEVIHRYLHGSRRWPFMDYFTLRRSGEDWANLTQEDVGKAPDGVPKAIVAVPVDEKGIKYLFQSGADCARHFGINGATVTKYLKSGKPCVSVGYTFYHASAYGNLGEDIVKVDTAPKTSKTPTRRPKRVEVKCLETLEVKQYESIQRFAEVIGSTKAAVARSVWRNNGRWRNYSIRYL